MFAANERARKLQEELTEVQSTNNEYEIKVRIRPKVICAIIRAQLCVVTGGNPSELHPRKAVYLGGRAVSSQP